MSQLYFTPGPAELYPTVAQHIQTALAEQVGSISHRSAAFRKIYQHTDEQLRALLNIPSSHAILFTGSATEIWERVIQNCVEFESFHCVNGSFSQKFYDTANDLKKFTHLFEKPLGQGFDYDDFVKVTDGTTEDTSGKVKIPDYVELVGLTANETSTGVQMRGVDINKLKRSYRSKLFCVDMVSSAPYHSLDFEEVDSAFFSVQKSFGLPAGLGVWIVNEKCLAKAESLKAKDNVIGSYHSLPSLWKNYKNFETPETPNVWNIYLLGKVAEDMNRVGIETIRRETDAKAKKIYDFLEKTEGYEPYVKNPDHRSPTVAVANTIESSKELIERIKKEGMIVGSGYGKAKDSQIRIANFPAVSMEQVERLLQAMKPV
ncbi:phosphoserine aminotransferase [Siphonobacter sp. SORGH_AS_0500]|uniref:aminotransferase class V-fold PLP-dependent enzyme n=1 Tax=Siphonobacter sp. SORGH_AS_0500 TaxID=1864824 RepID=UPI000CBAED07|nr:aminotransferase class V-fold PLP-dependent enzyme [Siphonobacter sp. SORGH_AS_0500]PKK35610.1 phosphoserine aminotransferase [Siphonobacter sp. SORGH_AS_0500]